MCTCSKCYFGNPLQQFSHNRRHCFKMEYNCACGTKKMKTTVRIEFWMFVSMTYDFQYLLSTYRQIAASVCYGTLINNMSVSDKTSLISSKVECMGLIRTMTCFWCGRLLVRILLETYFFILNFLLAFHSLQLIEVPRK